MTVTQPRRCSKCRQPGHTKRTCKITREKSYAQNKVIESATCPICMMCLPKQQTTTKCGHTFCVSCAFVAFAYKNSCPMCRERFISPRVDRKYHRRFL